MPYMNCDMTNINIANGQYNEDIKMYKRFFKSSHYKGNGYFVEIGGLNGISFSNSYLFEQCLGWKGMLIEANPDNYKSMIYNRPCATNIWSAGTLSNILIIYFIYYSIIYYMLKLR